jgi:TRAP-type C4-dicarboxylate transport system permease small subunit
VHELVVLGLAVAAITAVAALASGVVRPALRAIEQVLLGLSVLVILFVMAFVGAEVLMRYVFNSPIPGHLEGSELLMPIIVFLAISYTQRTHGHVGMDLLIETLPEGGRRVLQIVTLALSVFICAVLAYYSARNAHQLWLYDDVTMTPPYFKTWPAAAAIPLGYGLISLRMILQLLSAISPGRFPGDPHEEQAFEHVE